MLAKAKELLALAEDGEPDDISKSLNSLTQASILILKLHSSAKLF